MALSGTTLYYARRTDGTLHSVSFVAGVPGSTDTSINSTVDWRARSLFIAGSASGTNTPPTASATIDCSGQSCSFDGRGSSNPDGTVQNWSWDFGDGTTGSGSTTTHTYTTTGNHTVTLTVTDNGGATGRWTGTATTSTTTAAVGFVAASGINASTAAATVVAPSGIGAGDTELLFASVNTAGVTGTPTGLTGWTQLTKLTNSTLETTVWRRTAGAGDSGQTVTVPLSATAKIDLQLVDYSGTATTPGQLATAVDNTTGTHNAPAVSVSTPGSWVLTYWSDRSTGTTSWTVPSSVTSRHVGIGTGGGAASGVVADSNAPVATGTYPVRTATTNATSGRGNMVSLVLIPGS